MPPRESLVTAPEIIPVAPAESGLLAATLADAFAEDPCMNWVIPHTGLYPGFYRLLADKLYLRHGLVFRDTRARAAAMWLPPGVSHHVPHGAYQLWLVFRLICHSGLGILGRLEQAQEVMARHHPRRPHYYLHAIGVTRACQGMGLGSALLKQGTRICDSAGVPAYLESSSPKNLPLYERHGFEITSQESIGKGGPPLFFMWREPRQ